MSKKTPPKTLTEKEQRNKANLDTFMAKIQQQGQKERRTARQRMVTR